MSLDRWTDLHCYLDLFNHFIIMHFHVDMHAIEYLRLCYCALDVNISLRACNSLVCAVGTALHSILSTLQGS